MTNAGGGYLRRLARRSTSDVAERDADDLAARSRAGVDTGRTVKARGRIADREGREVLDNPDYELQNTA